jgi:hypothetical protein
MHAYYCLVFVDLHLSPLPAVTFSLCTSTRLLVVLQLAVQFLFFFLNREPFLPILINSVTKILRSLGYPGGQARPLALCADHPSRPLGCGVGSAVVVHIGDGDGDRCNLRVHGQHTEPQPATDSCNHSQPLIIVVRSLPSLPRCTSLPWRRKRFITQSETLENKEGRTGDAKFYEHAYTPYIDRLDLDQ